MGARLLVGIVGADAKGQGWAPIAHFPALRRHRLIDAIARHAGS